MRRMFGLMLFCCSFSALAADGAGGAEISATDKAALVAAAGKDVVIIGTIKRAEWSPTGKVMNVAFADSELVAAVFEKNKAALDKAFGGDAAKTWTAAKVKLTGKLETYGGKSKALAGRPQINISKAEQVSVQAAEETKKD